ncbi:hypothetical protein D3C71_1953180 [compost metagenome]
MFGYKEVRARAVAMVRAVTGRGGDILAVVDGAGQKNRPCQSPTSVAGRAVALRAISWLAIAGSC